MLESILIITAIMFICVVVLSPFYFFRKKNADSVSSGETLNKSKAFYWCIFVISAVVGSQAYAWFNFNIIFSVIIQTLAVFAGIFAVQKIWTSKIVHEVPNEISRQKSSPSKLKRYLAIFITIVLVGLIVIPRFIVQNIKGEINMEELRVTLDKSGQEFDVLRQELDNRDLMATLERQEGKPFEKIPMNVIKDFLNQFKN